MRLTIRSQEKKANLLDIHLLNPKDEYPVRKDAKQHQENNRRQVKASIRTLTIA